MSTKNEGLQQRYYISKVNGNSVDPAADYFVLRLDDAGEPNHVKACRAALAVYAQEIRPFLPQLAADLESKYNLIPDPVSPIFR
jgi:hypothetical protein